MESKIIAMAGKGGVGKTSLAASMVKVLVSAFPDKKILAIDADPAVGLSTALGVDVEITIDDIRKEVGVRVSGMLLPVVYRMQKRWLLSMKES